jgi:hypothetical protein
MDEEMRKSIIINHSHLYDTTSVISVYSVVQKKVLVSCGLT